MAASKRFMNWSAVGFTPAGGAPLIPITGVESVSIDDGGSLAKFAGDNDRYNSLIVNDFNEPTITVNAADIAALQQMPTGTSGTFTATLLDAKNGATPGGGARLFTFLCIVGKNSATGKHRAFGMGTITFEGQSGDGVTNPLSQSAV